MQRQERYYDPEETLRLAFDGVQSRLWTALPGIIKDFDPQRMVCTVQPAINGVIRSKEGNYSEIEMPLLLDCPVVFAGGGGVTLTFPLEIGDECLVVFASRCIDSWWQQGGMDGGNITPRGQAEFRMHDLSDGFVLPGVRSQPRAFDVDTAAAQLRSDDGSTLIQINPTAQTVVVTAPGGATINANVTVNGTLHVTGTITGDTDVVTGSISLKGHKHTGVQPGGGTTGLPT